MKYNVDLLVVTDKVTGRRKLVPFPKDDKSIWKSLKNTPKPRKRLNK